MLTFLNSIFAWALLAATIPFLIHLLTRKKLKKEAFSTLQFLKKMQKAKIRQIRLKQILLLLLRTLIIIFLVMAFMRPSFKNTNLNLGKNARATTVFIIDNSLSMAATQQGGSLLASARQQALQFLALVEPGDDIAVIEMAEPAAIVFSGSLSENSNRISQVISDIDQTEGESRIQAALLLAQDVISEKRNLNNSIFVFSDGKFAEFTDDPVGELQNTRLYVVNVDEPMEHNLSITDVELKNQIFELQRVIHVTARIVNSGAEEEKNKVVTLVVNNKRVAQNSISLRPGEERAVALKYIPSEPGLQYIQVELENDQLRLDNRAFAICAIQKTIRVLICANNSQQSWFLQLALGKKNQSASYEIEEITPGVLATTELKQYDVVVTIDVPSFTEPAVQKLENFARNGGGIVFFPGNEVDFRNYDRTIFSRFKLGSVIETIGNTNPGSDIVRLNEFDYSHALFAGIFEKQDKQQRIESPGFRFIPRLSPHVSARVLARYSNGSPFILQNQVEKGTVFLCLTSVDDSWSNFVYKPIFAPVMDRLVRLSGQNSKNDFAMISVGQTPFANLNYEKSAAFSLKNSRGTKSFIKPVVERGKFKIRLNESPHVGYYQVLQDETIRYTWVANFEIGEMQNEKMPASDLEKALPGVEVTMIESNESSVQAVYEQRFGTELWHLFLLFALFGLFIEMLMYRARPEEAKA